MKTAQSKTIDGIEFSVEQLPGRAALLLSRRLAAIGAPALAKAFTGFKGTSIADAEISNLGAATAALFDRLPESEFTELVDQLLSTAWVTRDGKRGPLLPVFDSIMQGHTATAYKLLWFAIEVNFGPFGGALLDRVVAGARAAMVTGSIGSTGPSGG